MLAIAIFCIMTMILVYFQVFSQGLFGTLIMAVLSIVSAQVALNYYEPLAGVLADLGLASFGPQTISLMGLFVLTLLGLRELSDRFIRGNMTFPQIIDRSGSVVFALISSLTITGMIALGLQMSGAGAIFLIFDRCPELNNPKADKNLYPCGDAFVLSLMKQTSNYCFAGGNSFSQVHPDMLRDLHFNRLIPKNYEGSRHEAAQDAISIGTARFIRYDIRNTVSGQKMEVDVDERLLVMEINIRAGSGKRGDRGAGDVDNEIRVSLGDFRLVGFDPDDRSSEVYCRYPLGYLEADGQSTQGGPPDTGRHFSSRNVKVNLVFSWPRKANKIIPLFVDFKHSARAEVNVKELRSTLREQEN